MKIYIKWIYKYGLYLTRHYKKQLKNTSELIHPFENKHRQT